MNLSEVDACKYLCLSSEDIIPEVGMIVKYYDADPIWEPFIINKIENIGLPNDPMISRFYRRNGASSFVWKEEWNNHEYMIYYIPSRDNIKNKSTTRKTRLKFKEY